MRQSVQTQQSQLPGQQTAELGGLQAQANQAHQDILSQAQNRGLGFSGIPVGEQAKYDATSFMPAVANLKTSYVNKATSLSDQLNKLNLDQQSQAHGILQNQQQRDEQQRQFDQTMAFQREQEANRMRLAQSAAVGGFGMGGGAPSGPTGNPFAPTPSMAKQGGGFGFTDHNGQAISAASYSKMMGIPFRDLLSQMAQQGDNGAKTALNVVGNDYGWDPNKVGNNQGAVSLLNSLLWGVHSVSPWNPPQQAAAQAPQRAAYINPSNSVLFGGVRR